MQRIKEVKTKRTLENLGAAALVILTYAVVGFMAGVGVGVAISLAAIFA